jgi:hypothetical protein
MEFLLIIDQLVAGTTPKSSKIIKIINEFYTISLSIHKLIKNLLPVCVGSLIDDNEFDNEFKERCNQQDNRKPQKLI